MNLLSPYKRSRFLLVMNVVGLTVGLAASILLLLFVVNEWSYDRHLANRERIVRLLTIWEEEGERSCYGINLRTAYTGLPQKIAGVEAVAQIFNARAVEVVRPPDRFSQIKTLMTDPEFFRVFPMPFLAGTPESALAAPNSLVLTRRCADLLFGGAAEAMQQTLFLWDTSFTVTGVVEDPPFNTHFSFDVLGNIKASAVAEADGLEFFTYCLIRQDASVADVRVAIEEEYTGLLKPFAAYFAASAVYGKTEMLSDVYLRSQSDNSLGKRGEMGLIRLLLGLSCFILLLAISNFVHLFVAQGENRMKEIAIRKTNGAILQNIVRQFFSEVSVIVMIAFVAGLILALVAIPAFSQLLGRELEVRQLAHPVSVLSLAGLFVVTVFLSASYPSFYLSRFSPLEIFGKRIRFSKRRLTATVVVFQSVVTVVLVSLILVINKQTRYLQQRPLGYRAEQVMAVTLNDGLRRSGEAIKQELFNHPGVNRVSGSAHIIGGGCSGQGIGRLNEPREYSVNEYRIQAGLCELMGFELAEGVFFKDGAPGVPGGIILNEAAVNMLNLQQPVAGQVVSYKGVPAEVIGVVKDFCYESPGDRIQPLVLSRIYYTPYLYIRFDAWVDQARAREIVQEILEPFDPGFSLNASWLEEVYLRKFRGVEMQERIITLGAMLSLLIAILGLVAIHLHTAVRRTKEIGIRRVSGASREAIFLLLSLDTIRWIALAALFAIPLSYLSATAWLSHSYERTPLGGWEFVVPVLLQCVVALLVLSVVTLRVLWQNPVNALRSE